MYMRGAPPSSAGINLNGCQGGGGRLSVCNCVCVCVCAMPPAPLELRCLGRAYVIINYNKYTKTLKYVIILRSSACVGV